MSLETYGRYQLLKKLATGGMAQIYLARQLGPEGFEKLLVVKRILPHLAENEDFITMFLDEARIAARLNHPNIVQIFDLGAQDDTYFIAMEFIHGEDIRRVWKHADKIGQPIPLALICRIIIDACAGLDYAHKKPDSAGRPLNIVHRDISPQNILVSFEGGVKVVDFGIAKAADQATVTKSGVLKGKYSYMSPEQAAGQPIDCRSDIFALGVVLYELLTGTRLFKRATDIQTLNAVTECKVAPASSINDRVPADLDAIVMKALTKDRDARFSEARHLGAALESWLMANKLPSGSAALAEFMHHIYAERLAREQEEGRLLVETAEGSRGEEPPSDREKATPSIGGLRRSTKSLRSSSPSQPKQKRELEPTMAERLPSRSGGTSRKSVDRALEAPLPARPVPAPGTDHPTDASMPTQNSEGSRRPLFVVVGVVLLALAGLGVWTVVGSKTAGFSLESQPPGASITGNGRALCTTPCVVDDLPPGELALTIEKAGFQTTKRSLVLKVGVHEPLPLVMLEPVKDAPVARPLDVKPAPSALVIIESDPRGAEVFLNGESVGVTPRTRSLPPGTSVDLLLELAGYAAQSDRFTVGEAAEETHRYALKALGRTIVKPPPVVKNPPPTDVRPPIAAAKGTVRFVVKPWALVDCPQARFKDTTPFQDQVFPVGEFPCTFTNPEFPPQTKMVHVEANATVKVSVTFQQQ